MFVKIECLYCAPKKKKKIIKYISYRVKDLWLGKTIIIHLNCF